MGCQPQHMGVNCLQKQKAVLLKSNLSIGNEKYLPLVIYATHWVVAKWSWEDVNSDSSAKFQRRIVYNFWTHWQVSTQFDRRDRSLKDDYVLTECMKTGSWLEERDLVRRCRKQSWHIPQLGRKLCGNSAVRHRTIWSQALIVSVFTGPTVYLISFI